MRGNMRTGKIGGRPSILTTTYTLKYRGAVIATTNDISILGKPELIRKIMISVIVDHMTKLMEAVSRRLDGDVKIHERPLVNASDVSLFDAYREAAKDRNISVRGNKASFNFLNMDTLDRLLPLSKNSKHQGSGGWWRIHEYGQGGDLVGSSDTYGFVTAEHLKKVLGPDTKVLGRHGEGFMVQLGSPFAKRLGVKMPFRGVKPKRILSTMQAYFRRGIGAVKNNMAEDIIKAIAKGIGK